MGSRSIVKGMMNKMNMVMACFMVMAVAFPSLLNLKGATAEDYVVGDSLGWVIPPNTSFYSEWAASKTFQIGDGLVFNWTGDHNVGKVASKEEYDNCTDPGIVFGPGVRIEITSAEEYYICTVGDHCDRGQKVAITVGSAANNSSPPPPPPSYASSLTPTTLGSFFGLIISTLVAISFLNHS
ncbi:hypothetical protein CerSpe_263940 [Prunus speciosa]